MGTPERMTAFRCRLARRTFTALLLMTHEYHAGNCVERIDNYAALQIGTAHR